MQAAYIPYSELYYILECYFRSIRHINYNFKKKFVYIMYAFEMKFMVILPFSETFHFYII